MTTQKSKKKLTTGKVIAARSAVQKVMTRIKDTFSMEDIIDAIKTDHDDLKKFIRVLKSDDVSGSEKKAAYKNFVSLLTSHASSEEAALYDQTVKKKDLEVDTQEGFVEHEIASLLVKSIAKTTDKARWTAKVKVLAELVEHHIQEEENDYLPEVKKAYDTKKKNAMASEFLVLRRRSQKGRTSENAGVLEGAQS